MGISGLVHARPQVCIIGAGKMSRLLVKHLASKGVGRVTVLNRSLPRAEELRDEFPEVEFDIRLMPDLMRSVAECDTIFAASGSADILVHARDLEGARRLPLARAHALLLRSMRCLAPTLEPMLLLGKGAAHAGKL